MTMMSPLEFLVLSLATWRIVCLFSQDTGPAGLFSSLRAWLVPAGTPEPGSLGQLLTCPYCLGVWMGPLVALAWYAAPDFTVLCMIPLALAGAVSFLQAVTFDDKDDDFPTGPPPQDNMLSG